MFLDGEDCAMQSDLFDRQYMPCEHVSIEDIFEAYYDCRKHKRRTANALKFELDFEKELVKLWKEVNNGTYEPHRSIAFIVTEPVQREIFAADFRDRIIHHLIINKINPLLEAYFIDDSFNCRKGKGVLAGVRQAENYMKLCSKNYTQDCYVLKLDLQSFFPSIDKRILFDSLAAFVNERYMGADKRIIVDLIESTIFNAPQNDCVIKGKRSDWVGLPPSKSLFGSGPEVGMPIGNLTSQIMANFYLTKLDKYIKNKLRIRYYARYVDDLFLLHPSKEYLQEVSRNITKFAAEELKVKVHPRKFYLQHYSKGANFIGAYIKPGRVYIGKRTKSNMYMAITKGLAELETGMDVCMDKLEHFTSSINSYLGFMVHYKTFKLRKKMLSMIYKSFLQPAIMPSADATKLQLFSGFKEGKRKAYTLRKRKSRYDIDKELARKGFVEF